VKILVAEDDPVTLHLLRRVLSRRGFEVVAASDGEQAWAILAGPDSPRMAVLDWVMPGLDGIEICSRVRRTPSTVPPYLLLCTALGNKADLIAGLQAGANDYVTKPFDADELFARLQVGMRVLDLQERMVAQVRRAEEALARVKQLQGMLPICAYCKKIRDDQNYWQQVESYICSHSEARFSHGICPECFSRELETLSVQTDKECPAPTGFPG
jgi:CheY-like chemotaxis protein